jgi:hypothetical protein
LALKAREKLPAPQKLDLGARAAERSTSNVQLSTFKGVRGNAVSSSIAPRAARVECSSETEALGGDGKTLNSQLSGSCRTRQFLLPLPRAGRGWNAPLKQESNVGAAKLSSRSERDQRSTFRELRGNAMFLGGLHERRRPFGVAPPASTHGRYLSRLGGTTVLNGQSSKPERRLARERRLCAGRGSG